MGNAYDMRVKRIYICKCTALLKLYKNRLNGKLYEEIYAVGRILKWSPMTHPLGETYDYDRISLQWLIMLYDNRIFADVIQVPNQWSSAKGKQL